MRLWLDDKREAPLGFDYHVKTAAEAVELISRGIVTEISLDHDLGSENENETGYFVAKYIELAAHNKWLGPIKWAVHSANPTGRHNMIMALKNADKYWGVGEVTRGADDEKEGKEGPE